MLRLVRHAVLKLDQSRDAFRRGNHDRVDMAVSMTYASAILGMVGACMMDDEPESDEAAMLRGLVADFVDPLEVCEYDQDVCQTHGLPQRPCPHERAKALLEAGE